jgi:hypothetical protein
VRLCSFMEMVKAFEKRGDIEDWLKFRLVILSPGCL